jgi:glycosyltransferase involved in cell wall biosynthesis
VIRILNVNASIDLKNGGGTAERTFQMSRFLARHPTRVTVLTLDSGCNVERVRALEPAAVFAVPTLSNRFFIPAITPGVLCRVRQLVEEADVIHLMNHWSMLNALVYLFARRSGKPYVVCPAGALPMFGRSRWLKRTYNMMVGNAIVRNAAAWIAITRVEFPQFHAYGIPESAVTVIPNGVSAEDFPEADTAAFLTRHGVPAGRIILFMGRLNPIKGPDLLLAAFLGIAMEFPDTQLVFAGPDGGMQDVLHRMAIEGRLDGRVHFLGHVSGADKVAAYRSAALLVVPSRQEAMSIVALEAGICGTPVLMTDACGFGEVRAIDERMEVQASVEGLTAGLHALLADSGVLNTMSTPWREFITRRYAWDSLAPVYLELYRGIMDAGSDRPADTKTSGRKVGETP